MAELPSPVGVEGVGDDSRYQSGAVCALERFDESSSHNGVKFSAECQLVGLSSIWSPGKYIMKTKWFCSVDSVS